MDKYHIYFVKQSVVRHFLTCVKMAAINRDVQVTPL